MKSIDMTNPNEIARYVVAERAYPSHHAADARVVVPADLHLTKAECVAKLLALGYQQSERKGQAGRKEVTA